MWETEIRQNRSPVYLCEYMFWFSKNFRNKKQLLKTWIFFFSFYIFNFFGAALSLRSYVFDISIISWILNSQYDLLSIENISCSEGFFFNFIQTKNILQ